jgi:preprotein translocase subunit SecA
MMRELERHLYLYTVDEHWRDHLYELDHLKGGIGLRAYGQRDPLIEYKREAYTLFEVLVRDVREDFVQRLFRVQLSPEAGQAVPQPRAPRVMLTQHAEAQAFGAADGAVGDPEPGGRAAGRPADGGMAPAPRVRTAPVVGRNDPCPCGSGKKYKKCHMLSDQGLELRP